jgi:hypothetical protein
MIAPWPRRKVSRSRKVIARFAGTVSSSGASIARSTLRLASSGNQRSTGSSSRSRHSSTRIMAAAATIGLVKDAMRKMLSRRILAPPSAACAPMTSTCTSPRRSISVTRPGTPPCSTWPAITSCMRPSRAFDNPPVLICLVPPVRPSFFIPLQCRPRESGDPGPAAGFPLARE